MKLYSPRILLSSSGLLALVIALLTPTSAHAYIYGGGGSYGFYNYGYGGYDTYNGYTGPGGGPDTPHRGTWQTRFNTWAQREAAWEQAEYNAPAPCGIWGRAPAGCYLYTRPYIPWIDGDR